MCASKAASHAARSSPGSIGVEAVTVNLNVAEIEDLLHIAGIDRNAAERALTVRDFIALSGLDRRRRSRLNRPRAP